jgi:hypothetical protein
MLTTSVSNESIVTSIVKNTGLRPEAVAALLGNIAVETGDTFDYTIKQRGVKNPAIGLLQFDPKGKLDDYLEYLKENSLKDSPQNQINYFIDTIYGRSRDEIGHGVAAKLREVISTGDYFEITIALSRLWFRPSKPHLDRRLDSARYRYFVNISEAHHPLSKGITYVTNNKYVNRNRWELVR